MHALMTNYRRTLWNSWSWSYVFRGMSRYDELS